MLTERSPFLKSCPMVFSIEENKMEKCGFDSSHLSCLPYLDLLHTKVLLILKRMYK